MHASRIVRPLALAVGLALAGPVTAWAATTPTAVTFPAGKSWAQEVNTITHDDASQSYTFAVTAGNTLKINLISPNPSLFFRLLDETRHKKLVDTQKTGASTWSTEVAEPTTYTLEVYADPAALKYGNTAKYALQIGQYNPSDLQPPSTTVTFENNAPWAQFTGSVDATGPAHDYLVAIPAGETLKVNLIPNAPSAHLKVMDSASNAALVDPAASNANTFTTTAAAATTFKVRVYANPADVPSGQRATYALQIGHYTTGAAAPAGAGSVPAEAGSVPAK